MLLIGQIDLRNRFAGWPILPEITHNSDDSQRPLWVIQATENGAPQWVLSGKSQMRQRLVNDDRECRVIGVTVVEVPSTLLRNTKRCKCARCYDGEPGRGGLSLSIYWQKVSPDSSTWPAMSGRHRHCPSRRDPWHTANLRQ